MTPEFIRMLETEEEAAMRLIRTGGCSNINLQGLLHVGVAAFGMSHNIDIHAPNPEKTISFLKELYEKYAFLKEETCLENGKM